ncbi:stalk domain-containing protein [Paenibacillus hexagrammi]|uniref:Copper amine oxidase-like N-terminal domain-containing protein n=1 Tax=Paenibacillus hexagrammi TaxID=2908839 RepID=A0ABY3SLN7_9BACL|nr:stalk domain-containing protein [Paenibacillus sp. YPD9-1]UJF34101.1 hypothetical protein L0M14_02360 [Paenibacillus sp. YPD9-1]
MVSRANWVKIGLAALLAAGPAVSYSSKASAAFVKSLTMKEAVDRGLQVSSQLRDAKTDIRKKKIELEQAKQAVKAEEAKASGLFAKPHNLSQDLNMRMKVPEASKQLYLAQETWRQAAETVKVDVEKAYLQAFQDAAGEQRSRSKWEEARKAVDTVRQKRKYGLAKPEDQEAADQALEKAASEYKQAQLTAKASRLALGQKLGLDMENEVQLSFQPDYADLSQQKLPAYLASAQKTTLSLLQDTEDRRLADQKLNTTRDLYSSKFGAARMRVMDGMYKSQDIDMDLFMAGYDTTLEKVKKDWEGFFLLLGFIPIPKWLLQGEYDGLRYLDDLHNGLPVATMEQNKALLKEKESRTAVIAEVRQSYLEAKGAEESYAQALRDKDKAAAALEQAAKKLKLGLMKTEELQAYKDAVTKADQQILLAQIGYKTALGKLDTDTGGAVDGTLKQGILPYKNIDDGLAAVKPDKPKPPVGTWRIKPAVGPLLSDVTVTVNKKLGATEYAVVTQDNKPLGKRAKPGKAVRTLTLAVSQPDGLKVVLYKKGEKIGEYPFAGKGNAGTLEALSANAAGMGGTGSTTDANGAGSGSGEEQAGSGSSSGTGDSSNGSGKAHGDAAGAGSNDGGASGAQGAGSGSDGKNGTGTVDGNVDGKDGSNGANEDKEASGASPDSLGTVMIGTYQIALEALTPAAYNAASATVSDSGQGMFYKSAEPGAGWFGLDNAVDPSAITDPSSSAAVSSQDAAKWKVTVAMDKPGEIASKETPEELQQEIDTLKKNKEQLEADKDAAVAAQKLADIADLAVEIKDAEAKIAMLEALQKGDSSAALQQMELVNNPDALIQALAEESEAPAGGGGAGNSGGGRDAASGAASEDALAAEAELQQKQLEQAVAAGDAKAAAAQLQQLMATQARLADVQNGTSEGLASLKEAKQKLEAALKTAQAQQDQEQAESLARSLDAIGDAMRQTEKDALFAEADAAQELLAALEEAQPDAGSAAELAQQQAVEAVMQQQSALLDKLKQQEAGSYTPEELQALAEAADAIKEEVAQAGSGSAAVSEGGGAANGSADGVGSGMEGAAESGLKPGAEVQIIPPENVISPDLNIHLEAPPVMIDGNAYIHIRPISESFGAAVDWDHDSRTVTVSTDYSTVVCTVKMNIAYVDGQPVELDAPPVLLDGRTYVPLRFVSESLGLIVDWNAQAQTIQISKP